MINSKINKKIYILVLFLGLFVFQVVSADQIEKFDVELTINEDASIDVMEKITYTFTEDQKNEIVRDISFKYINEREDNSNDSSSGNYKIRITDIRVTDKGKKKEYPFKLSNNKDHKSIVISDPENKKNQKEYIIFYKVHKAIKYAETYDKLDWSVTGKMWPIEIAQARIKIKLPYLINENEISYNCFESGSVGNSDCLYDRIEYEGKDLVNSIIFVSDSLKANEEMRVDVNLPKGVVEDNEVIQNVKFVIQDDGVFLVGFSGLIFITFLFRKKVKLWIKKNRKNN